MKNETFYACNRPMLSIGKPPVKTLCAVIVLLAALLILSQLALESTFDVANASDNLPDQIFEDLYDLDLSAFDSFLRALDEEQQDVLSFGGLKTFIYNIANGRGEDFFTAFWKQVFGLFLRYFLGFLPSMITILIIVVVKNILSGLTSSFKKKSTEEIIHYVCYCAVVLTAMVGITDVIHSTVKVISRLTAFAEIVFPILSTLLIAVGAKASAGLYQPLMAVLTTSITALIGTIILPMFTATIALTVVGNLSKNVKLEKLTAFLRKIAEWVLGVAFSLFVMFTSAQGIAGSTVDKVSYSAARFALSSYVPVLGGYLSGGFDLVASSMVVIKNSLGSVVVLILVAIVIFPAIKIAMFSLGLKFVSAISEPLGDARISSLCNDLSKCMSLLVTAIAGIGFMFFIIVMLVMSVCPI